MSDELTQRVIKAIAATKRIPAESVTIDSDFALENEFDINIPDDDVRSVRDIRGMCDGVERLLLAKSAGAKAAE